MQKKPAALLLAFLSILHCNASAAQDNWLEGEWTAETTLQLRHFPHDPLAQNSQQHNNSASLAMELEYYAAWDDYNKSLTFTPFVRLDQHDDERSHADLREFSYQQVFARWELRVGISKVFWGVTESQHLVDVINQTDQVENIDGEDKFGQPMIKASMERDWGILDVFVLPGFRERSFQGIEGRPRPLLVVDTNQAAYESSDKQRHIDYALRWFNYLGDIEMGLSYFNGTSREPLLIPGSNNSGTVLTPYYPQMQQAGLDAQLTTAEWLWKLELIARDWQALDNNAQLIDQRFVALTGGFEYTFVGIAQSAADLGLVAEYLYDDRDEEATSFFQNDVLLGLRLAMNDTKSSEALIGVIHDLDNQEFMLSLEASRRFAHRWTASLEVRSFNRVDNNSPLAAIARDDFIQLDITRYF
ncbi:MAG TPA: hypothetical protein VIQ81_09065 [Gammaproteobacteria bacterium]